MTGRPPNKKVTSVLCILFDLIAYNCIITGIPFAVAPN